MLSITVGEWEDNVDKLTWITSCSQLAEHYMKQLSQKCSKSDEIHVVFDRYDFEVYLKSATRVRRLGGQGGQVLQDNRRHPYWSRSAEETFVSTKLKWNSLNTSQEKLDYAEIIGKRLVADWGTAVRQHRRMWRILEAPKKKLTQKILLRRYPQLCHETNLVTGTCIQ